jgi:hypothetical protein
MCGSILLICIQGDDESERRPTNAAQLRYSRVANDFRRPKFEVRIDSHALLHLLQCFGDNKDWRPDLCTALCLAVLYLRRLCLWFIED